MARRPLAVLIALAVVSWGAAATAQVTARQIVQNSVKARGGAAGFAGVRSLSYTGVLDFGGGQSAPMSVWLTAKPARIRIEVILPAGKMIEAFDGKRAWQQIPGGKSAVLLHGAAARRVQDQALNGADLLPTATARVRLLSSGTRAGHRFYRISLALASGDVFTQSIDATTWLAFEESYPGGHETIAGYQHSGGVLLPTQIVCDGDSTHPTTLVIQHTALNVPIPAATFQMPAALPGRVTRPGKP